LTDPESVPDTFTPDTVLPGTYSFDAPSVVQPGDELETTVSLDVLWIPYNAMPGENLPGQVLPDATPYRVLQTIEVGDD
jgi:hypothetical protein